MALQGQLHDADLANPLLAAFGNFDAAFVFVLLTPLLAILLTYDVWSSERERGTWDLVRSQPVSALGVLALKLATRGGVALAPLVGLLAGAAVWLRLPLDAGVLGVLALTALYVAVWVGASALVAAFGRSSDFNLVALAGVWVVWGVLGPALVNVVAASRFPLPEPLELTVLQRQGYHGAWDRPVTETMDRFYERYPEWRGASVPTDTYSNAWYYAMQQRGDDAASSAAAAYSEALERRRTFVARASLLFPPAGFQLALNDVARTDLRSHRGYLASVSAFHEELKRFFLPVIFSNQPVTEVDWAAAPAHRYRDERPPALGASFAAMGVTVALLSAMSLAALRRRLAGGHAGG